MQIVGYAAGGALLAVLGAGPALMAAAALAATSAVITRTGLVPRRPRATGRRLLSATTAGNARLLRDPTTRALLLAGWIPNGLIVGAEALFVPYAGVAAAALFIAASTGMLAGDVAVGRWLGPVLRDRLVVPLTTLLAVPYLVFALRPPIWAAVALVAVSAVGFRATLLLQERLVATVPDCTGMHWALPPVG